MADFFVMFARDVGLLETRKKKLFTFDTVLGRLKILKKYYFQSWKLLCFSLFLETHIVINRTKVISFCSPVFPLFNKQN